GGLRLDVVAADHAGQAADKIQMPFGALSRLTLVHRTRSAARAFAFCVRQISIIISAARVRALCRVSSKIALASEPFAIWNSRVTSTAHSLSLIDPDCFWN